MNNRNRQNFIFFGITNKQVLKLRKDTMGIILVLVGAAVGFLGAVVAQGDINDLKLFTILIAFTAASLFKTVFPSLSK